MKNIMFALNILGIITIITNTFLMLVDHNLGIPWGLELHGGIIALFFISSAILVLNEKE